MDEQLNDPASSQDAANQQPPVDPIRRDLQIDPLRRVWIPIERKTIMGQTTFSTHDKVVYGRLANGVIRRAIPKVNGKEARKARRANRT